MINFNLQNNLLIKLIHKIIIKTAMLKAKILIKMV